MFVLVSLDDRFVQFFGLFIAIATMVMVMFGLPLLLVGTLLWAVCYQFTGSARRGSPPGATSNSDSPPRES
jgi:hypothetical protein